MARAVPEKQLLDMPAQSGPPDSTDLAGNLPKGWVPPNAPQFSYSKDVPDARYPSNQRVMEILRDNSPKKAPLRALNERRDTSTPFGTLDDVLDQADSLIKQSEPDPLKPGDQPMPVEVVDLLLAAQKPDFQQKLAGREIEITGQVLDSNSGNFRIMRLLILCCAADAQPLAVQVQAHGLRKPSQMTWVKVTGKAIFTKKGKATTPAIQARKIEVVPQPEEPFLY